VAEDLYKIILQGYGGDKGEYYVEEEFANLFNIPRETAKELFSKAPITIKKNISEAEANRYSKAIKKTGAKCDVENMKFDLSGLSLE